MAKKRVDIFINQSKLLQVQTAIKENYFKIMDEIIKEVPNFSPIDTATMISTHGLARTENSISLFYGSINDDGYNKQVIAQHEEPLGHLGSPSGASMRTLAEPLRTTITGTKYLLGGKRIKTSIIRLQRADYQKGYRVARKSGLLRVYPTLFASQALEVVAKRGVKSLVKDSLKGVK